MPKIINYPKNSMIFVEGDKDDRIFILQSGYVILVSTDFETGRTLWSPTLKVLISLNKESDQT